MTNMYFEHDRHVPMVPMSICLYDSLLRSSGSLFLVGSRWDVISCGDYLECSDLKEYIFSDCLICRCGIHSTPDMKRTRERRQILKICSTKCGNDVFGHHYISSTLHDSMYVQTFNHGVVNFQGFHVVCHFLPGRV